MIPAAVPPAVALIAGAATGISSPLTCPFLIWLLPPLTAAAIVAWSLHRKFTATALVAFAFGCCGFVLGVDTRDRAIESSLRAILDQQFKGFRVGSAAVPYSAIPVAARILLSEDASFENDVAMLRGRVLEIRVRGSWVRAEGDVVLSVVGATGKTRFAQWRRGRTIEGPVAFRRPARYLNDGVRDFERDAALDGISLLGSIKSGLLVDVVGRGTRAAELAADLRADVRRAVLQHVGRHSHLSAAVVSAVLIGDRSGLPDDVRTRLQAAGTYHVIAISGGNIAIFTALVLIALAPSGLSGRRAAAIALMVVLGYAFIVTAGASVWRATLVAGLYLFSRILDHRAGPWQAMAIAGGVLAVAQPLDVRNAGFVLTFGATAALLTVARHVPPGSRWRDWLVASIVTSVAVEIALLPVMAQTFSRVTVAGLVLNLVAVPAMAVVQVAGVVVVCASGSDVVGGLAGWLAHGAAMAILDSARLVDAAPWLARRVPPPSLSIVIAYYAGVALALLSRTVWRPAGVACVLLSALLIVFRSPTGDEIRGLRLTMLDVGQGDAMLLQNGSHSLMVDSGGSPFGGGAFDVGSQVIEPALWARGVASLQTLLLTHGDPDHIGGAIPLLDDFRPRVVWQGIPVQRALSLRRVLARARESGASVQERRRGEEFPFGMARVVVLHPPIPDWERPRVRNDDSVVIEVVYGDVALLLAGDISGDVERDIIAQLIPARTRILKVAHHGSRTSTSQELLDAWRPQFAVISCGRGNPFGHPAPDVIARLEASGSRIYRTDRDGEITIDTDGHNVGVRTFTRRP